MWHVLGKKGLFAPPPPFLNICWKSPSWIGLKIRENFTYEAHHFGVKCILTISSSNKTIELNKWCAAEEGLKTLKSTTFCSKKDVIKQQISSMRVTIVGDEIYKIKTVVRACEYFARDVPVIIV